MAVGLTSAYGFDAESGDRFIDPVRHSPSRHFSAADQARFRKWAPYGIREALLFLASGDAYSPVVKLSSKHFYRDYLKSAIKIPNS